MLTPKQTSTKKTKPQDSSSGGTSSEELSQSALMKKKQDQLWDDIDSGSGGESESRGKLGNLTNSEEAEDGKLSAESSDGSSISTDGLSLAPFGEDGPSLNLKPGGADVTYTIPGTGFYFPPPKGKWEGPSLQIPIATPVPGLFINISGGLEGGLKVPELEMNLSYKEEEAPGSEDLTKVVIEFKLANGKAIQASFGGNIRVGVLGGVPMVAAIEAGVEAATEAKIEIEPSIGGKGEYILNRAGDVETSRTNMSVSMGAGAGLEASLSLYIAGQLIMFKGDLYKLTLISKEIASIKGGATMARTWKDGKKGANTIDPIYEDYFVAESWFKDLFTADKLDKASANITNAQYDVYALEDLKHFLKMGGKQGQTASSAVRVAMSNFRAAETEYIMKNQELESIDSTSAKAGKLRKDLEGLQKKMIEANKQWSKAQDAFYSSKNIKNVDKNLTSSIKSLEKTKDSNSKLMLKELKKLEKEYGSQRDEVLKKYYAALNSVDQINKWLEASSPEQLSFYQRQLDEANKEKLRVQNDLDEFMRIYNTKEAKIREVMEIPSKNPIKKEGEK